MLMAQLPPTSTLLPYTTLFRSLVLTGDRLTDAQPGFDNQTNEPAVHLRLDGQGARVFQEVTRESINKRMAILRSEEQTCELQSLAYLVCRLLLEKKIRYC